MSKRKSSLTEKIIAVALIIAIVGAGAYLLFGPSFFSFIPGTETAQPFVNPQFYLLEEGGEHAIVASCAVNVYDANGNFLQAATSSAAGLVQLASIRAGTTIQIQARQAAVASADPYVSPVITRVIPLAGSGDTVTLMPVYVWDVTETPPTFAISDQGGKAILDAVNNCLNTTDTSFTIYLSAIDTDTAFGMEVFIDKVTGYSYIGPILVWKGTASQVWAVPPDFTVSDPTNVYYAWRLERLIDSSVDLSDDMITKTIRPLTGFVADATVNIDVYDHLLLGPGGSLVIGNLANGAGGNVVAIATRVL